MPLVPKKVNIFFGQSFQHGLQVRPGILCSEGYHLMNQLVPELFALRGIALQNGPGVMERQFDRLNKLNPELGRVLQDAYQNTAPNGLRDVTRIEVVFELNCGDIHCSIKFFKKNEARNYVIWQLTCKETGQFTQSSITSSSE